MIGGLAQTFYVCRMVDGVAETSLCDVFEYGRTGDMVKTPCLRHSRDSRDRRAGKGGKLLAGVYRERRI